MSFIQRMVSIVALIGCTVPLRLPAGECPVVRWVQRRLERPVGAGFVPSNVYRSSQTLPADLRRVAVLPLVIPSSSEQMLHAQETLGSAVGDALSRSMAFEVVLIEPEALRRLTGRSDWRAQEPLPRALLDYLRQQKDCQAVIFAELSQFQAYGALQIGWKLKLVDSREAGVYWAADQIFDAGATSVAVAAKRFAQDHDSESSRGAGSQLILSSPRRFGAYTLSALFATLPSR